MQQLVISTKSSSAFINSILNTPLLKADEEFKLLQKYNHFQCKESIQRVFISSMKYVVKLASKYSTMSSCNKDDLIQEGVLGMYNAINNFNLDSNVRFLYFAIPHIKHYMKEYVNKNYAMIGRIYHSKREKVAFSNLVLIDKCNDIAEAAELLGINVCDIERVRNRLNINSRHSIEVGGIQEGEFIKKQPLELTDASDFDTLEYNDTVSKLMSIVSNRLCQLTQRQQEVIRILYLSDEKVSKLECGRRLGISCERVRQIDQEALKKLRGLLVTVSPLEIEGLYEL